MASRDLNLLHPALRALCKKFISVCACDGIDVLITCTGRTSQEQQALYAQGRKPLSEVNLLRMECGLYALSPEENKRKVTWTLNTKHLIQPNGFCNAFDFALYREDGKAHWDLKVDVNHNEVSDYKEAGAIAVELGLVWGGNWKTPDYPHCELDFV